MTYTPIARAINRPETKRTPVEMVSIQAGDDLPSEDDSDAELQYSPEKANGRGPPLSYYDHSPERQPAMPALGGSSKSSPVKTEAYPPPVFKDE